MKFGVPVCYVDPHDVKDLVCDKIHKEEHISFAVSMDDENSLLSPQPINLSFISEKDNLEGWHLPVHWFRRPYLYLYLVDNSKEPATKEQKKNLKNWSNDIGGKQEWIVIQFIAPEQPKRMSVIPFYDKNRLDVPRDRYFQVQMKAEGNEEWNDIIKRIKECLKESFQKQIREYKSNISTLLKRSNIPGWNFCNYFVVSEGLAFTMIQCGQLETALEQYNQLLKMYMSLNNESKLENFIYEPDLKQVIDGTVIEDIKEWSSEVRRELIYQNQVSEIQFLEYVCSRRFFLLVKLNRTYEALKEVLEFLQLIIKKLSIYQKKDDKKEQEYVTFKALWAFSAGFSVFILPEIQDYLSSIPNQLTRDTSKTFSLLGDLLYFVRTRLDYILDYSSTYFKELNEPGEKSNEKSDNPHINISGAIKNRELFDKIYFQISEESMKYYKLSEYRPRSVTRLMFDVATLHYERKDYQNSADILKQITIEDGWHSITTKVRIQLAECAAQLQNHEMFISASLGLLGPECPEDIRSSYQNRVEEKAISGLNTVLMRDLYPLIDCRLKTITRPPYLVGGILVIECILESFLLNPISFRKLSISMIDGSSESFMHSTEALRFTERKITVNPGKNVFELQTSLPSKASFKFDKIRLELGNLVLSQQLRASYEAINVDNSDATLELEVSRLMDSPMVGQIQAFQLTFTTNEDTIENGAFKVGSETGLSFYDFEGEMKITSENGDIRMAPLKFQQSSALMPPCNAHEVVELFIPVKAPLGTSDHELSIVLSYVKDTQEAFDIVALVDISFVEPFYFSNKLFTTPDSLYVQILGKNNTNIPVSIKKHNLTTPSGNSIQQDKMPLSNQVIVAPQTEFSFVYPLANEKIDHENNDCYFLVQFTTEDEVKNTLASCLPEYFEVDYTFSISKPPIFYDISLSIPPTVTAGVLFPFTFKISAREETKKLNLTYTINIGDEWLIVGHSKREINLENKKPQIITVNLLPMITGWISLPTISLEGIHKENIFLKPNSRNVQVIPPARFDCRCLSDKY